MMYRLVCAVVRAVLGFYFFRVKGLRYEGAEHIPAAGPMIVAPNHKSNFDPPVIGVCSPRIVHYMAKEELFRNPVFAAAIRYFGTFPVKRGTVDRGAVRQAVKTLKEGHLLGIFPEGTRTHGDRIGRFHDGMASIALMTGTPILPVAVLGTEQLPKREGPLAVIFGAPVPVEKCRPTPEKIGEVNRLVREELLRMRKEYMEKACAAR